MSQPIDVIRDSLPDPDLLKLEGIDETEEGIVLGFGVTNTAMCSSSSVSYHST